MTAGLISLPFAYANYQKKKAAYDAALAKYESLKASGEKVVDAYQNELSKIQDILVGVDEEGNYAQTDNVPDLKVSATMQVGMLVGKKMRVKAIVAIENTSKTDTYYVSVSRLLAFDLMGSTFPLVFGCTNGDPQDRIGTLWRERSTVYNNAYPAINGNFMAISPGGYIQFESKGTPFESPLLSRDQMKMLRECICYYAGKKLITSVGKGYSVPGDYTYPYKKNKVLTAKMEAYRAFDTNGIFATTQWNVTKIRATLEYMGEAWYPNQEDAGAIISSMI